MSTTIIASATIKRVKHTPLFDVFKGQGWKGWTRFTYPTMRIVGGEHLPRVEVAKVFHTIKAQLAEVKHK